MVLILSSSLVLSVILSTALSAAATLGSIASTSSLVSIRLSSTTTFNPTAVASRLPPIFSSTTPTFIAITTFSPVVYLSFESQTTSHASSLVPTLAAASAARPIPTEAAARSRTNGAPLNLQVQTFGGFPSDNPDVPAASISLFLFLLGAIAHIGTFAYDKRRGIFFPISIFLSIFCVVRIVSLALRMSWAQNISNVKLAIAASVFFTAATAILYVVNLVFTYRIIRSQHPSLANSKSISILFRLLHFTIAATVIILITAIAQTAYTANSGTKSNDRDLHLFGLTYMAFVAFLPLPIVFLSLVIGHRPPATSKLGPNAMRRRIFLVVAASLLLTFRATWICASTWRRPTPLGAPIQWYFSKTAFYLVGLLPELLVVYLWALGRVDRGFYVGMDGNSAAPQSLINDSDGSLPDTLLESEREKSNDSKRNGVQLPGFQFDEEANEHPEFHGSHRRVSSYNPYPYPSSKRPMSPLVEEGRITNNQGFIFTNRSHESIHPPILSRTPSNDDDRDFYPHDGSTLANSSRDSSGAFPLPSYATIDRDSFSDPDFPFPSVATVHKIPRRPVLSLVMSHRNSDAGKTNSTRYSRTSLILNEATGRWTFTTSPLLQDMPAPLRTHPPRLQDMPAPLRTHPPLMQEMPAPLKTHPPLVQEALAPLKTRQPLNQEAPAPLHTHPPFAPPPFSEPQQMPEPKRVSFADAVQQLQTHLSTQPQHTLEPHARTSDQARHVSFVSSVPSRGSGLSSLVGITDSRIRDTMYEDEQRRLRGKQGQPQAW